MFRNGSHASSGEGRIRPGGGSDGDAVRPRLSSAATPVEPGGRQCSR